MRYAVISGLSFALGVFVGQRIWEWLEDFVWNLWQ